MNHLIKNPNRPVDAQAGMIPGTYSPRIIPLRRETAVASNATANAKTNVGLIDRGIDMVDFEHPITDIVELSGRSGTTDLRRFEIERDLPAARPATVQVAVNPGSTAGLNQSMRVVMILAAMAWAAQLLLCQWVHAEEPVEKFAAEKVVQEKFVPASRSVSTGATLELRGEATVIGEEITLKQICRWADADVAAFEPLADLVIVRMGDNTPFRSVSLKEVKSLLNDAGANLGMIRFAGSTSCTISRSDAQSQTKTDLRAWADARNNTSPEKPAKKPTPGERPAVVANAKPRTTASTIKDVVSPRDMYSAGTPEKTVIPAGSGKTDAGNAIAASSRIAAGGGNAVAVNNPNITGKAEAPQEAVVDHRTLKQLLVGDLAERLNVEPASLQLHFNPVDDKTLLLAEPYFRFKIDSNRARSLGDIVWEVTVVSNGGSMKGTIEASARAWQEQLKVIKPLSYHQTIQTDDIADSRVLVDNLGVDPQIKREQIVGQWAAHEIKAGTVLTTRMIDAAPMVKSGQLVTVISEYGNVKIKAVGRAQESGSYGATIKIKNEITGDVYEATLTGAQTAYIGNGNPAAKTKEQPRTASTSE